MLISSRKLLLKTNRLISTTFYHKDLKITKSTKLLPFPNETLSFGKFNTDHIFQAKWTSKSGWSKPEILPFYDFKLHPFNTTFQYAQSGIEGFQAFRDDNDKIRVFRPIKYAENINRTCAEICFPTFDKYEFVKCLDEFLNIEQRWVPMAPNSLYVRPAMFSLAAKLGVQPPTETLLFITASPYTNFFGENVKAVKLRVETEGKRAWPNGLGHVNASVNYVIGMRYVNAARQAGFDQVLWLNDRHITEVSGMNIFVYWENRQKKLEIATPALDGTIMPGVTRDSILEICRQDPRLLTSERQISINELLQASKEKRLYEIFLCGAEISIMPVESVTYKNEEIIPENPKGEISLQLKQIIRDIQFGKQ